MTAPHLLVSQRHHVFLLRLLLCASLRPSQVCATGRLPHSITPSPTQRVRKRPRRSHTHTHNRCRTKQWERCREDKDIHKHMCARAELRRAKGRRAWAHPRTYAYMYVHATPSRLFSFVSRCVSFRIPTKPAPVQGRTATDDAQPTPTQTHTHPHNTVDASHRYTTTDHADRGPNNRHRNPTGDENHNHARLERWHKKRGA